MPKRINLLQGSRKKLIVIVIACLLLLAVAAALFDRCAGASHRDDMWERFGAADDHRRDVTVIDVARGPVRTQRVRFFPPRTCLLSSVHDAILPRYALPASHSSQLRTA